MSTLPLSPTDLARRRPVWIALSELFLDTELQDFEFASIAGIAVASAYTDAELHAILLDEVAPVVWTNLLCIIGVWSGFEEEWLCAQAARYAVRRFPHGVNLARYFRARLIQADWDRLVPYLAAARGKLSALS